MDFMKTSKIGIVVIFSIIFSAILFYIMLLLFSGGKTKSNEETSSLCDGSIIAKLEDGNCIENPSIAIKGRPPYKDEYNPINIEHISLVSKSRCSCYSNSAVKMKTDKATYSDKLIVEGIEAGISEWFCINSETCQPEINTGT